MAQDATFVCAKELFAKELFIINSTFVHVIHVSLNTLMYFQYKYFKYSLCSIGI
jgi:hypothetical protein